MDTDDEDPGPGGVRPEDTRFFKGTRPGGVAFRVGDVGPDPPYKAGSGQFLAQGLTTYHREAPTEAGGWEYPPLTSEMEEAGFEEIRVYIKNSHNMVAQYIKTRQILDLCEKYVWMTKAWVSRRWWE